MTGHIVLFSSSTNFGFRKRLSSGVGGIGYSASASRPRRWVMGLARALDEHFVIHQMLSC